MSLPQRQTRAVAEFLSAFEGRMDIAPAPPDWLARLAAPGARREVRGRRAQQPDRHSTGTLRKQGHIPTKTGRQLRKNGQLP